MTNQQGKRVLTTVRVIAKAKRPIAPPSHTSTSGHRARTKSRKGSRLKAVLIVIAGVLALHLVSNLENYFDNYQDRNRTNGGGDIALVEPVYPGPTVKPQASPSRTPRPTITPEPTSTPSPTNTTEPTNTPGPTNTPKPTRTPRPTSTPKPTPPGIGEGLIEGPLHVTLVDYEFRSQAHQDPAAIEFVLTFTNGGNSNLEVQYSLEDIVARSDTGTTYLEFYTIFKGYDEKNCLRLTGSIDYSFLVQTFTLAPGEERSETFWLNPPGTRGCRPEDHMARVSFGTEWVDLEWPINYHPIGSNVDSLRLNWRLSRN